MNNNLISKFFLILVLLLIAILDYSVGSLGIFNGMSLYLAFYVVLLETFYITQSRTVLLLGLFYDLLATTTLFGYFSLLFLLAHGLYFLFHKTIPNYVLGVILYALIVFVTLLFSSALSFIIVLKSVVLYLVVRIIWYLLVHK